MPTQAPTYAAPVVVTTPATAVDSPPGSATLNGYVTFPPGTPVSYHYEYFPTSNPSNITLTPDVSTTATGGAQVAQVCVWRGYMSRHLLLSNRRRMRKKQEQGGGQRKGVCGCLSDESSRVLCLCVSLLVLCACARAPLGLA